MGAGVTQWNYSSFTLFWVGLQNLVAPNASYKVHVFSMWETQRGKDLAHLALLEQCHGKENSFCTHVVACSVYLVWPYDENSSWTKVLLELPGARQCSESQIRPKKNKSTIPSLGPIHLVILNLSLWKEGWDGFILTNHPEFGIMLVESYPT